MIEPFYAAAIPEPRTILGLKLRPLSLGHIILLNRIESPFFGDGNATFGDLAAAILICSLSYSDGCDLLNTPGIDDFMRRWHDRLTGNDRWTVRLGLRPVSVLNWSEKLSAFAAYVEEHSKTPHYQYAPGDFREMDCPPVQIVKVTLMRDLHIPEAELMDRSWLICRWDFVTLKALAGHVQMVNGDDIANAQAIANRLQEKFDKARANGHGKDPCQG